MRREKAKGRARRVDQLKVHLQKATERTIRGLWDAIGRILDLYTPAESANYFAHCGYDAN